MISNHPTTVWPASKEVTVEDDVDEFEALPFDLSWAGAPEIIQDKRRKAKIQNLDMKEEYKFYAGTTYLSFKFIN